MRLSGRTALVEALEAAAEWVRSQDGGPDFQAVLARVIAYVQDTLR
jgi:hypothetical protein